ncbi:hypothetical protein V1514DRAFT_52761 [Lipomyces japonicus]|uniref:uncharacterized protein n=1 Tax=Lipomyces japonicus TaxID=56871 RepID=UPI0034CE44F4
MLGRRMLRNREYSEQDFGFQFPFQWIQWYLKDYDIGSGSGSFRGSNQLSAIPKLICFKLQGVGVKLQGVGVNIYCKSCHVSCSPSRIFFIIVRTFNSLFCLLSFRLISSRTVSFVTDTIKIKHSYLYFFVSKYISPAMVYYYSYLDHTKLPLFLYHLHIIIFSFLISLLPVYFPFVIDAYVQIVLASCR